MSRCCELARKNTHKLKLSSDVKSLPPPPFLKLLHGCGGGGEKGEGGQGQTKEEEEEKKELNLG